MSEQQSLLIISSHNVEDIAITQTFFNFILLCTKFFLLLLFTPVLMENYSLFHTNVHIVIFYINIIC